MASSSSIFSAPFVAFTQTKPKPNPIASWVCSSMASSHKSSFGSSKSAFFQHGFSLKSPNFSGFVFKPRSSATVYARAATEKTIYDFTVKDIDGTDVSLNKFKGKVLLIVNVASKCGLTSSNYSELSHIYEKYKPQGFEILAFPCNQFGGQEPGSNPEIKQFACTRFKAEFPIFDKVDVNGPNTAPVYQFLKSTAGGFLGDLVKWNFEKFLVDKNGKVVERYQPTTSPLQIEMREEEWERFCLVFWAQDLPRSNAGALVLKPSADDRKLSAAVEAKKVIIKSADMKDDLQKEAIDIAISAFEKHNVEKDVAEQIKKEFDRKHGPTWHCIVGKNFEGHPETPCSMNIGLHRHAFQHLLY